MDIGAALAARRAEAVARVAALQADLDRMIQSSVGANADDEHDPEGATVAFERAQLAALLAEARRRVADLDAARGPRRRRHVRPVRALRRADPAGPPRRPPHRDDVRPVRPSGTARVSRGARPRRYGSWPGHGSVARGRPGEPTRVAAALPATGGPGNRPRARS